jgi:diacylglycerol kinase (ATP)
MRRGKQCSCRPGRSGTKLSILVNPRGGRGRVLRRLEDLRALGRRLGAPVTLCRDADDLTSRARCAVEEGAERLLVAGGDGTLHYALPALVGGRCALGILPLGTGNDLAGALGIPNDLHLAARGAVEGPVRRIDLGRVDNVLFAGVAGLGFDSDVARRANRYSGPLRGRAIYLSAILRTVTRFTPLALRLESDGGSFDGRATFAVVANSPRYGAGVRIAPEARLDDGLLDVVIVKEISRSRLLANLPSVLRGRHLGHPSVVAFRCRRATITAERETAIVGDGEAIGGAGPSPIVVEVLSEALTVAAV